jgi:hypothetical protein
MHGAYSDHSELMKITQRLGEVISALDHKTNRWLELSEFVK